MALFMGNGRVVPITMTHFINNQSKSGFIPSTESIIVTPDYGYTGLSQVIVNAIPSTYVKPSGTYIVTNSGLTNIKQYASASVPPMMSSKNSMWITGGEHDGNPRVSVTTNGIINCNITIPSGFNDFSTAFTSGWTLPTTNTTDITIIPSDTSQIAIESQQWIRCNVIVESIPLDALIYKKIYEKTVNDDELNIYLSNKTSIGSYMFMMQSGLSSTIIGNNITTIGASGFYSCYTLQSVSFPNLLRINANTFNRCSSLTIASFPEVSIIEGSAFTYCKNLTIANFPKVTIISAAAFSNCYKLSSLFFPLLSSLSGQVFYYCSSITSISFPELSTITGYDTFSYCIGLISVTFPKLSQLGQDTFWYCSNLTTLSLPAAIKLCANATPFRGCRNLISLYLMNSSVTTLSYSNVFSECPIGNSSYTGTFGSIYVPSSLLTTYKTATNWSYYSDRFVGI